MLQRDCEEGQTTTQRTTPSGRSRSAGSSRLDCIASQLSAPGGDGALPRPLSNGIATLARSMAMDETIMLRVRELVTQQLMTQRRAGEDDGGSSSAAGWDVVSDASTSPFVPIGRPHQHHHQHPSCHHQHSPSQDTTSDQDDFEQIFSLPFRRVTSLDFPSQSGTPHRGAGASSSCGDGAPAGILHNPRSCSTLTQLSSPDHLLHRGDTGDVDDAYDLHQPPPRSSSHGTSSATSKPNTCGAVAVVDEGRSFFDLVTWSTSVMWHHVSSALRALWDVLHGNKFRRCGGQDQPQPKGWSLGSSNASASQDEGEEARTTAFMAASAILLNAAVVYAVSQRLSVRETLRHASGIIRDVFTTGLV